LAEITVIAEDGGVVAIDEHRVPLEPGEGVAVERTKRRTTRKPIFVPKPLKPTAQLIVRVQAESDMVSALSDEELATITRGPLAIELRGMVELNVAQLDEIARQADDRGVEMIVRLRQHVG
jgi:hypothetical protein